MHFLWWVMPVHCYGGVCRTIKTKNKLMKKIIAAGIILSIVATTWAQVDFREIVSSEGMDKVWEDAGKMNKPVFVDIYATWCGPCKWMDANVFAAEEAGNYMNREFINVKMDGESGFGRVFALQSGLSAYPSFFLFNSGQKLMNTIVGAKPWEELKPQLVTTLEYYPVLEVLQNKFESGLLDQEEYPRFARALREMGKEEYGTAVAGTYREKYISGTDWSPMDLEVMAFYTEQQTENWNRLVADIPELKAALGDELEYFIDQALTASIELAVEMNDITPVKEFNELLPELTAGTSLDPVEMKSRSHVYFYHYTGQFDEMIAYIDREYESSHKGDHEWLFNAAANAVFLDPQNEPVAEKGLEWFSTCLGLHKSHEYYYHLALCQYFTDSPELAVGSLKQSLEYAEDPEAIATTERIIQQVEEELARQ
jgi:thiol-disulfide isomerase/thioredoxin